MGAFETDRQEEQLSPMALGLRTAVQHVFSAANQPFPESQWAIVARNGNVFVVRGNGSDIETLELFLRPQLPEGDPLPFLRSLGSPDERKFYSLPADAMVSFGEQAASVAVIPGADLGLVFPSPSTGEIEKQRVAYGEIIDPATLLDKTQRLLVSGSPQIFTLV